MEFWGFVTYDHSRPLDNKVFNCSKRVGSMRMRCIEMKYIESSYQVQRNIVRGFVDAGFTITGCDSRHTAPFHSGASSMAYTPMTKINGWHNPQLSYAFRATS